MIHVLLIAILFSVPDYIESSSEPCLSSRQLEDTCGSYCYKAVKPLLDHLLKLQRAEENRSEGTSEYLTTKIADLENEIAQQEKRYKARVSDLEKKLAVHEEKRLEAEQQKKIELRSFEKIGSKYYYINVEYEMNWFAAGRRCAELGGHLASIQSEAEYQALVAKLIRNRNYWIDLSDLSQEGVFLSQTTNRQPNFLKWFPKNPDNYRGVEHCVHLWSHKNSLLMNDNACNAKLNFICEHSS